MYDLSIVIPVFNKWNFTKFCLNHLFKLSFNNEIIIIDNASSDETQQELLKITNSNFVYVRNEENYFHSKACNMGYKISNSDNVLFLNNDIKVIESHSNWTNNIIRNCNDAIIGPTMGLLDNNLNFVKSANTYLNGNSYISGWCIASSKKHWNKLDIDGNGQIFNEKYPFYFNDTELSFRARKLGIPLKVVPVPVVHFGKISTNSPKVSKLYIDGRKIFIGEWQKK